MFIKKIISIVAAVFVSMTFISLDASAKAKHHSLFYKKHYNVMASRGTMPPFAYIQFCVHNRSQCQNHKGKLAMIAGNKVKLNSRLTSQLASVNASVNASMAPRNDRGPDSWKIGGKSGDCEDYALTKRARLIAAGWPSSALSMTVVRTRSGEGHAILSVKTSSGVLVLDNLNRSVRSIKNVPYMIVSMQSSGYGWSH